MTNEATKRIADFLGTEPEFINNLKNFVAQRKDTSLPKDAAETVRKLDYWIEQFTNSVYSGFTNKKDNPADKHEQRAFNIHANEKAKLQEAFSEFQKIPSSRLDDSISVSASHLNKDSLKK
jgi:hypothetical protein